MKTASPDGFVLHICCAPCLASAQATLAADQEKFFPAVSQLFFYNPNIHPLLEFRRRIKALRVYLERDPVKVEIDDAYGLESFLARIPWQESPANRCAACYAMRLERTAQHCKRIGANGFSSTLLASREQDRKLVARIGHEAAEKFGISFYDGDLRKVTPDERMLRGIYKQQYCGCVFSEKERFIHTAKHLYHPAEKTDVPSMNETTEYNI